MKYNVIYKCGHEGVVELVGKFSYREYKLEELKRCLCPECEIARMKKEAEKKGLAELEGSDKQIAWALSIRESALYKLNDLLRHVEYSISDCNDDEDELKKLNKRKEDLLYVIEHESKQTSAVYFIDNRLYYDKFLKVVNVRRFLKNVIKTDVENKKTENEKVERKTEVHPENQLYDTVVALTTNDKNDVVLKSEYNKILVDTIHKMPIAMSWNVRCLDYEKHWNGCRRIVTTQTVIWITVTVQRQRFQQKLDVM